MASLPDHPTLPSLRKWLRFVDKQIDKEALECLKLALYTEIRYSEVSKLADLKPSQLFAALESMQNAVNRKEVALSKFVYCLKSIGASLRGKWCVSRIKNFGVPEVDPLDVATQTKEFQFSNKCLLKVYRGIRKTDSEEKLKRYFGKEDILNENHRNFESTPHMFILLLQQRKITPDDQALLIKALKDTETKHCLVYVKRYRRGSGLRDLEELEKECPDNEGDDEDPFTKSSSSGAPDSFLSQESDGDEAQNKSLQRPLQTRKRKKGSKDAGEGSRPLPIRPRRSVAGSLQSGISSGSAASKGTLVATSVPAPPPTMDKVFETEDNPREDTHLLPAEAQRTAVTVHAASHLQDHRPPDEHERERDKGSKLIWCQRITAVVALLTLVAAITGLVLTSKVGNTYIPNLTSAVCGGSTVVVDNINQFYTKSLSAREDVKHGDISQEVEFIISDMACRNLPLLTDNLEQNGTVMKNITGLYLMHGSYISFSICATANSTSPQRGELYVLNDLTEARYFNPQIDKASACFRSFQIGYSQDKQPWRCTNASCPVHSDGYYSLILLDPDYPVQYSYTLDIVRQYIDLSSVHPSWNCTVNDEDDEPCFFEYHDWVLKESCLIARIGGNEPTTGLNCQKRFAHVDVDRELQESVLIVGYVLSGLTLLVSSVSLVVCVLRPAKKLIDTKIV